MCISIVSPAGGTIINPPSSISTSFGSPVTLNCTAEGGPNNTFQWTSQGQVVSDIFQLHFPSITGSDGGLYTCTATNAAGSGSATVTITGNITICIIIASTVFT